ncbi:hypothetical protein vBAmePPT11V19_00075 [Alteromonas phage vB_AmeP_PT11-V19]|nr:hypothetical protein vBAmePPT11V19_00075 [Alteromonas phage vB_AmeP_PT11-V19]
MSNHKEILSAMVEGKCIHYRSSPNNLWAELDPKNYVHTNPLSYPNYEWRVYTPDTIDRYFNEYWKRLLAEDIDTLEYQDVYRKAFLDGVEACKNGEYY